MIPALIATLMVTTAANGVLPALPEVEADPTASSDAGGPAVVADLDDAGELPSFTIDVAGAQVRDAGTSTRFEFPDGDGGFEANVVVYRPRACAFTAEVCENGWAHEVQIETGGARVNETITFTSRDGSSFVSQSMVVLHGERAEIYEATTFYRGGWMVHAYFRANDPEAFKRWDAQVVDAFHDARISIAPPPALGAHAMPKFAFDYQGPKGWQTKMSSTRLMRLFRCPEAKPGDLCQIAVVAPVDTTMEKALAWIQRPAKGSTDRKTYKNERHGTVVPYAMVAFSDVNAQGKREFRFALVVDFNGLVAMVTLLDDSLDGLKAHSKVAIDVANTMLDAADAADLANR